MNSLTFVPFIIARFEKKGDILALSCPSVILSFCDSVTLLDKTFRRVFLRNFGAYKVETWYTLGQWVDVSCIWATGCYCIFIPLFLPFTFPPIFKH